MTTCAGCGHDNGAAARFCEACGAALDSGSGERRKVVSVLFCDMVGSTALGESTDPEALRALLARYFDRMKRIVESHGGSVEKFIGDAVMAVLPYELFLERAMGRYFGATPVSELLAWLDDQEARGRRDIPFACTGAERGDARSLRRGAGSPRARA